jgi:hypothetical protein
MCGGPYSRYCCLHATSPNDSAERIRIDMVNIPNILDWLDTAIDEADRELRREREYVDAGSDARLFSVLTIARALGVLPSSEATASATEPPR